MMKCPFSVIAAAMLWVAVDSRAAEPPVITIATRDSKPIESYFPRGKADWDQLGVFELRRTGETAGELRIPFEVSGTARRYEDYILLPGEPWFPCACLRSEIDFRDNAVVLPAGSSSILLGVRARPDGGVEGAETVVVRLLDDSSVGPLPRYVVGESRTATVTIADTALLLELEIMRLNERTLHFVLPQGSLVIGKWDLELSHDLRIWQRVRSFSPGNVAAFARTPLRWTINARAFIGRF